MDKDWLKKLDSEVAKQLINLAHNVLERLQEAGSDSDTHEKLREMCGLESMLLVQHLEEALEELNDDEAMHDLDWLRDVLPPSLLKVRNPRET